MASSSSAPPSSSGAEPVKVILVGDSLVGKTKLVERFLMEGFTPQQLSTEGLTLFRFTSVKDGKSTEVDFWDTAGQERFNSVHKAYYMGAHCCILCFDVKRQRTYKNLEKWYAELCSLRPGIPCIMAANKIDVDPEVINVQFKFAKKHNFQLFYVSASEGTNVVSLFEKAIELGIECQKHPPADDYVGQVAQLLHELDDKDDAAADATQ